MAKFIEIDEELQELVNIAAEEIGIAHYGIEFKAIGVEKAKEPVKLALSTDRERFLAPGKVGEVLVILYEDAFNQLGYDEEAKKTKYLWIRMALDVVTYDPEKDKLAIKAPMITCPQSFYASHGEEAIKAAELGLLTIQQLRDANKGIVKVKKDEK